MSVFTKGTGSEKVFFLVPCKKLAKDTVFLKYLVTFVPQKRRNLSEGLKKIKWSI